MSAYFETGFSIRDPAWHGQADVYEDYPEDWAQARVWAGLEWDVIESGFVVPMIRNGHEIPGQTEEAAGFKCIRRNDTGAILSVPTEGYGTVTIEAMGEIIDAALESDGKVRFETAGSLRGGKNVWALVWLEDAAYQVTGDSSETLPFMAILNTFDGSGKCKLVFTSVRVICWNTFSMAEAEGARHGTSFAIRHTGNVAEKIEDVKAGIKQMRAQHEQTLQLFEELAQIPVDETAVKTFTQLFLPSPADHGEFVSDRVAENVQRARGTFRRIYDASVSTEDLPENGYRLLQSATEYLDHVRAYRSPESKMGRSLLRPEAHKTRAVALIRDLVAA